MAYRKLGTPVKELTEEQKVQQLTRVTAVRKHAVDWEGVRRVYEGDYSKSLTDICKENRITYATVMRQAIKGGWVLRTQDEPNWVMMEREYRSTFVTVAELSRRYATTANRINYRIKMYNWTRDITRRISIDSEQHFMRAKVQEEMAHEFDLQPVGDGTMAPKGARTFETMTKDEQDLAVVRAGAEIIGRIKISQAKAVAEQRQQLETDLKALDEFLRDDHAANLTLTGWGTRLDMRYRAASTLKVLIELEREIHNMPIAGRDQDDGRQFDEYATLTETELEQKVAHLDALLGPAF